MQFPLLLSTSSDRNRFVMVCGVVALSSVPDKTVSAMKSSKDGDADGPFLLSDFPDEILCRIIAFLPAKDVVRTGVLSKRWQHLWFSVPFLELHENEFPERSLFMSFVERTLLLRDSSSLEACCLGCDVKFDTFRINSWITAVVRRKVRKLYLQLGFAQQRSVLPSCLFRCESLMKLKLDMRHDLVLLSSVCLSSLKCVRLKHVRFVDSASVQNLFSSPALESISIDGCHWVDLNNITVSAPNLWNLAVRDSYSYGEEYGECRVVINVPKLKQFGYAGNLMYGYSVVGSSSFVKAWIHVSRGRQGLSAGVYASTLLEGLYNVCSLTLSGQILKSVSGEEDSFGDLPIFCNVTELRLYMPYIELDLKMLARLLGKCPCLAKLEIEGFPKFNECHSSRVLEPVPPCFESQLKKIVVRYFSPTKESLDFVALLLRKATVLEMMVIYYGEKIKDNHEASYLKKLPRGSKNCEISLIV